MANTYSMPAVIGGGPGECGGGWGYPSGGGACGACDYCYPGNYGPVPSPDAPCAFLPTPYPQVVPPPICPVQPGN